MLGERVWTVWISGRGRFTGEIAEIAEIAGIAGIAESGEARSVGGWCRGGSDSDE
jgi:hypothetical protein